MSLGVFWLAMVACLVVIVVSGRFIIRHLNNTKMQRQEIEKLKQQVQEERGKKIDSIRILLQAAGSEELGWIEASIRVKVLLDQLSVDLSDHEDICTFYRIYELTEHIPTHEGWNQLPSSARQAFRKEMLGYERDYVENLIKAKAALQLYPLN